MTMHPAGGKQQRAEINITPLIDVLLVLLIIFMVITPSLSRGLNAIAPQSSGQEASALSDDIVLTVLGDGTVRLQQEVVNLAALGDKLKAAFGNAADPVVFVHAAKNLEFSQVAEVIDIAKGAGLNRVALMTALMTE